MPIKDLLEFIGVQNVAEELTKTSDGKKKLDDIGERVKRQFDEDLNSMQDWMEAVREGLDLMKQEFNPKSTPWQGASNFKSPILSEASIAFGDKASLEILRSRNLVKADVIGRDRTGEKKELADRVTEAMNYQVNHQMTDWREDQKRMFYVLSGVGCMFKKTDFDPLEGRAAAHIIQYPDFAVNQATTSMETARSFTQILDVDKNGVIERQAEGTWLSDEDIFTDEDDGDEGSNEAAMTLTADDNSDRFLEQQCFADLDDDGYEEPYTVTIHEQSRKIVRIVPRFDTNSFIVKTKEGRVLSLVEAIKQDTMEAIRRNEPLPDSADLNRFTLVRINPTQKIVKYGFIPSLDGTFLDLGYTHMLGAIVQGVNTTTNQLTDTGTLRNLGGGFLAKGFRKKMGPLRMQPGEWKETNIAARDLQSGMFPNPSPEPSSVLFQLNEKLEQQGRSFAATVDIGGQISSNTAPTTALAIIQEALISTSALMGRILDSMSKEFQILFNLNKTTFDPELYKVILDEDANAKADFNNESLDIKPTASPEMSSKLQRIQLATVEMEAIPAVIQAGGNPMPIVKAFFDRIGSDNIDEIFPEQPTDQQAQEIAQFREAQEQANQLQLQQQELTRLQTEVLMREQDRLDADTQRKIEETQSKMRVDLSNVILNLEKAESEDVKNQVSKYTAQVRGSIDTLAAIGQENVRTNDLRNQRQAQQEANLPRPV